MSIQDTAATLRQYSVNTEVIIREEPGTNSSASHEAGAPAKTRKTEGFFCHTETPFKPALKELFHGTSKPASPELSHSVLPLGKEASGPKGSKSSFQGIYSHSGNVEMQAEAAWPGSESSWTPGKVCLCSENQELYSEVGFPPQAKKTTLKIRRLPTSKCKMMGGQEVSGVVERNQERRQEHLEAGCPHSAQVSQSLDRHTVAGAVRFWPETVHGACVHRPGNQDV